MKNLYILLIALLAINGAMAQGCLPEGITFEFQEQIDNFQVNYPGCTDIEGFVVITGPDISNLNGLSALSSIVGDLVIESNQLTSLTGLENLTFIGGNLYLNLCHGLTSLTGLNNLSYVGGDLQIGKLLDSGWGLYGGNVYLASLTGLETLASIGGNLTIEFNASLINLTGLSGLTSIGGGLTINYNGSLTSITGLENLTSIGGDLSVRYNDSLISMTAINNVTAVGGELSIINNPGLTSLSGLENIEPSSITNLTITYNGSLSDCAVLGICNYLAAPNGTVDIFNNSAGCNNPPEVAAGCGISLPCLPFGNYYFMTQAEIDDFPSDYPGCTEIEGSVVIYATDISNLNGLSVLTSIGDSLSILFNDILPSLQGLEGLTFIGGDLLIGANSILTNLTGLEGLIFIGGDLIIGENSILTNLTGLEGLTSLGGKLRIFNNGSLSSLIGIEGLNSIGGDLEINANPLSSLTGLDGVTSIGGGLYITGNYALSSLNGLEGLTSIGGVLQIHGNNSLTSLSGLDNLNAGSITNLSIIDNYSLSTCDVQSICDYLASPNGTVNIYNNETGCNNPPEVASGCGISLPCLPYGNYYFLTQADIDNFQTNYPDCADLYGDVIIYWYTSDIKNLNGLLVLTSIGGELDIWSNDSLSSLSGLENLISIEGNLHIYSNITLSSLTGLDNLTSIGGTLGIAYNSVLTNLSGLEGLNSIGDDLLIVQNNALIALTGLDSLSFIGGDLLIGGPYGWGAAGNPVLKSISALENIEPGSINQLKIIFNDSLSDCAIRSICNYLASPNGTIEIHDNASGCNSQQEVEAACQVGLEEVTKNGFAIYPNPTTGLVTISQPANSPHSHLTILNLSGQETLHKIITGTSTQVDFSSLPSGIYFVRLTNSQTVKTTKLIKQ